MKVWVFTARATGHGREVIAVLLRKPTLKQQRTLLKEYLFNIFCEAAALMRLDDYPDNELLLSHQRVRSILSTKYKIKKLKDAKASLVRRGLGRTSYCRSVASSLARLKSKERRENVLHN